MNARAYQIHRATIASLVAGMVLVSAGRAEQIRAEASASWIWSSDDPTPKSGQAAGDGTFTVGQTSVTVGGQTNSDPQKSYKYSGGFESQFVIGQGGNIDKQLSTGSALDSVKPVGPKPGTNLYDYTLKAYVLAAPYLFGSRVSATAQAADPQQIISPGVFGNTLSLGQGSFVYISGSHLSEGDSEIHLQATAPGILSEPIATIDVVETLTSLDVNVHFSDDPRLQFFYPGTTTPISETSVKALLTGSSSLYTASGLTSDLPLFNYQLDLSNTVLTDSSSLGSGAQSYAEAVYVPEPGSSALLASGVGIAVVLVRRRLI